MSLQTSYVPLGSNQDTEATQVYEYHYKNSLVKILFLYFTQIRKYLLLTAVSTLLIIPMYFFFNILLLS